MEYPLYCTQCEPFVHKRNTNICQSSAGGLCNEQLYHWGSLMRTKNTLKVCHENNKPTNEQK